MFSAHPRLLEEFCPTKDGVQIEILRSLDLSKGIPVILVPGMLGTASMLADRLEVLAPRPGITMSHRGCGKSSSPVEGHYDFQSRCQDIEAVVDHFQLKRYFLYGFSRGVALVLQHCLQYPERVAGLVLDDAEPIYPELSRDWLDRMNAAQFLWAHPFALERIQLESEEIRFHDRLSEIKAPSLIFRGVLEGSLLSREAAVNMQKLLHSADLIHLPQSGHGASLEDFPMFQDALVDFFNRIDPAS